MQQRWLRICLGTALSAVLGSVAFGCGGGDTPPPAPGDAGPDGGSLEGGARDGATDMSMPPAECGNGELESGELCDDSNTVDGDGCRGDCLSDYTCGNGVVDTVASGATSDEVCDDGNSVNGDGCDAACASDESCGNNIIDLGAGEVCDDGNTADGDSCSADCTMSLLCGNGAMDAGEECDDSNVVDGDGCSAACLEERCGNGRVDAGDACDDGNADDADGCRADCTFTCSADADCADADVCNGDEVCTDGGSVASRCGAGTAPADGTSCGASLICNGGACVAVACGDGLVTAPEECDDLNTVNGDGCDNDCTFSCVTAADCNDTNSCTTDTCTANVCANMATTGGVCVTAGGAAGTCNMGTCAVSASCGNGMREGTEQCDDGDADNTDGCRTDCTFTCTAANVVANCGDGNTCNGAERCTMPGTLASRCAAGAAPAPGTVCDADMMPATRDICRAGACVPTRCGDGFRDPGATPTEACDDGNMTNGDGCETDCTFTCTGAADCADGNTCNGAETCMMPSSVGSRCVAGAAPAVGTVCDADGMAGTRDICRAGAVCTRSTCGDGFTDPGATPVETCDDSNVVSGDGCSATCTSEVATPPTGFRITNLDLISPRVVANALGCRDLTQTAFFGFSVNGELDAAITTDYTLHIVDLFRPYNPAAATTPMELQLNAVCMAAPTPDSCGPDPMPDTVASVANNQAAGTCFTPVATEVNGRRGAATVTYTPTANTVSAPCFTGDETTLNITMAGIVIPLQRASLSATYSGTTPNRRLVSGVVRGFLSSTAAADVVLPASLPVVGGQRLYSILQAGGMATNDSTGTSRAAGCNVGGGGAEDDRDMNGSTQGFWFFLNFTAAEITWTGP